MEQLKPYQRDKSLLEVIHNFIKFTASAESPQEIFWAITKNFMEMLQIEDCVVYEALPHERKIIQRAAHGAKNPNGDVIHNLLVLEYGEGIVGWVAENQTTVCIGDARLDSRYIVDDNIRLSELSVPIQFNGELFGIIDSENSQENFYNIEHIQLFELIAELAATLLVRIRQKEELGKLKEELEHLLLNKKKALDDAIETVSEQVSELKHHEEKREILIREVHHRVNNNLQILTSLISIYLYESEKIDKSVLEEIKQKIQTLSSIHLILLKSVENNRPGVQDFLLDLIASIRYMNDSNYLILTAQSWAPVFSMNTLIPLGMLINQLVSHSIQQFWNKNETVEINLAIIFSVDSYFILELNGTKSLEKLIPDEKFEISKTLIDVFIDQLEGEILTPDKEFGIWKIKLKEIE
ncbi:MAG: histidine kinase dimerization/phosphoacceptor domain -containing protein [Bacteroidota bacterium]